jgi:hypothetical protein
MEAMAEQRIVRAFEIIDFEDGTFGVLLEDYVRTRMIAAAFWE